MDNNHRPSSLWFHAIGTKEDADSEVYDEKDTGYFLNLGETLNKRFLILSIHNHETSEIRLIDQEDKKKNLKLVEKRHQGVEYSLEHDQENARFIILTNLNNAVDYKIMETNDSLIGQEHWTDLVSYKEGVLITDFACLKSYIIIQELEDGIPRITTINKKNNKYDTIKFNEEVYDLDFNEGFVTIKSYQIYYSSMTTPLEVYEYDLNEKKKNLIKKQELPSGHNPNEYVTKRVYATSEDGEYIPISILKKKDTPNNSPTLLYGYGSYGISIAPSFSAARLSLVETWFGSQLILGVEWKEE